MTIYPMIYEVSDAALGLLIFNWKNVEQQHRRFRDSHKENVGLARENAHQKCITNKVYLMQEERR